MNLQQRNLKQLSIYIKTGDFKKPIKEKDMSNSKQNYNSGYFEQLRTTRKRDPKNYFLVLNLNQKGSTAVYYDALNNTMKVLDTKTYKEKNYSYPLV